MRHLIIGSGVVGTATGIWLRANCENVTFYDILPEVLKKLKNRKFNVTTDIKNIKTDIYWICTAEWDVEGAIKQIIKIKDNPTIVIRSTMPPGFTEKLSKKYKIKHIAHVPEFLRQKTAIIDMFERDRLIIGTNDIKIKEKLKQVFNSVTKPIIFTTPTSSELIKYAANCWLASQISYWNEIKIICDKYKINPQLIANAACLDKRISNYGTAMIGEPYAGFCFPKDMDALIKAFEENGLDPIMLKAIRKRNEMIKRLKEH